MEGWLDDFTYRWKIRGFGSNRECGNADESVFERKLPKIKELIGKYDKKDANKTEIPDLMFIDSSLNPLIFITKPENKIFLHHLANRKAWKTTTLFYSWLQRFQEYNLRTPERKALLLIDGCIAHGTTESLPAIPDVEATYLLPDCISKVQPRDVGVIASFKMRSERIHMERALGNVETEASNIYKVDMLTYMPWSTRAWNDPPSSVVGICWYHNSLYVGDEDKNSEPTEKEVATDLQHQIDELLSPR